MANGLQRLKHKPNHIEMVWFGSKSKHWQIDVDHNQQFRKSNFGSILRFDDFIVQLYTLPIPTASLCVYCVGKWRENHRKEAAERECLVKWFQSLVFLFLPCVACQSPSLCGLEEGQPKWVERGNRMCNVVGRALVVVVFLWLFSEPQSRFLEVFQWQMVPEHVGVRNLWFLEVKTRWRRLKMKLEIRQKTKEKLSTFKNSRRQSINMFPAKLLTWWKNKDHRRDI